MFVLGSVKYGLSKPCGLDAHIDSWITLFGVNSKCDCLSTIENDIFEYQWSIFTRSKERQVGPLRPTLTQIPDLVYDRAADAAAYKANSKKLWRPAVGYGVSDLKNYAKRFCDNGSGRCYADGPTNYRNDAAICGMPN